MLAAISAALLMLAGCGSGEPDEPAADEAGPEASAQTAATGASVEAAADPGRLTSDDVAAIAQTIVTVDMEGGCDLLTDRFLEEQTFDSDPQRACETYEDGFVDKQYSEEDLVISEVTGTQQTATATYGSTIADLTLEYMLVNDAGIWKIDAVDF